MRRLLSLLAALLLHSPGAIADTRPAPAPGYDGVGVFDMPMLAGDEARIGALARAGDLAGAAAAVDELIARHPEASRLRIVQAAVEAARGNPDAAVSALLEADRLGAAGLASLLASPPFDRLAADSRLAGLTDRPEALAPDPAPAIVANGEAVIAPDNTAWDGESGALRPRFAFPPIMESWPVEEARDGPMAELARLAARGFAAGNVGDLYDNRDDGHSLLRIRPRTQLTRTVYGPEARAAGLHYGLNEAILFDRPTFGNSSTALTGALWRSQMRYALTSAGGPARLWRQYAANHVYVFPAHRDFGDRFGDVIPAMTPYAFTSVGSSGSDRALLRGIRAILAALRPETKARLTEAGLIAPMIQQIMRRALVADDAAYLTPAAHPVAIAPEAVDLARLIDLAQSIEPDAIPPMTTLRMLGEAPRDASVFADGVDETLFDTPAAIARAWRGAPPDRVYAIEAMAEDPNGRDLAFHWRLISGDPALVEIQPISEDGARARITVRWHDPEAHPRIDVAAFADNGAELSAPAFFSLLLPPHQEREYAQDGRPLRIAHRTGPGAPYADPLIWPRRGWEDRFAYAPDGALTGWTRVTAAGESQLDARGLLIEAFDGAGRPTAAREMRYPVTRDEDGTARVAPAPGDFRVRIEYQGPDDLIGRAVPATE